MSGELPPLGTIAAQLAIVVALVLANGFFVAAEFALVSVRRTRIEQLAAEGNHAAAVVQRAVRDITRYIAATQVGVTVASLLLGGLGEQILEPIMLSLLGWMPANVLGVTRVGVATGLAYFVMTTMHVVIGELMPKSIALQKAEVLSLWLVRPMTVFVKMVTPLVWMLNALANVFLRLLGIHAIEGHEQVHSPEELDLIFAQSHDAGELTKTEFEILHNVVRFSDLTAREVMVPRVEMKALPLTMTRAQLQGYLHDRPHTRVPVYRDTLDDIAGIAHLKDLIKLVAATPAEESDHEAIHLTSIVRDAARVPETITIDRLLVEFKRLHQQMAIVIDEYGGTSGIVTMGDLLEQAFGDVHDEFDRPEPEILQRPDGSIQLSGRVRIEEVNERFSTGFPTDEVDTMAGLVMDKLGRVAAPGDEVTLCGVRLRVEAAEPQRIVTLSMWLPDGAPTDENTA